MWDDPDSKAYARRQDLIEAMQEYEEEAMDLIRKNCPKNMTPSEYKNELIESWIEGEDLLLKLKEIHMVALKGHINWFEELYEKEKDRS